MEKQDIISSVQSIMSNLSGIDIEDITPESKLQEDLDFDLLTTIELAMNLEDEFYVVFPDADIANFTTVSDIVEHIYQNI